MQILSSLIYALNVRESPKFSGSRNTTVTSDFRPEVEIWLFRAYAMHPAIIIGTVRLFWTWLWGRYHVPQNVFLVSSAFTQVATTAFWVRWKLPKISYRTGALRYMRLFTKFHLLIEAGLLSSSNDSYDWLIEQGLTSHSTHLGHFGDGGVTAASARIVAAAQSPHRLGNDS